MTENEFIAKLGNELGIPPERLEKSALLTSFSAWDSMGRMAVVAMLDAELSVEVPPGGLQRCQTVGDLIRLVGSKIKE